jgi:hypothetical protein
MGWKERLTGKKLAGSLCSGFIRVYPDPTPYSTLNKDLPAGKR